jgi:hypothetical protein
MILENNRNLMQLLRIRLELTLLAHQLNLVQYEIFEIETLQLYFSNVWIVT